jgi:hypothetical protein
MTARVVRDTCKVPVARKIGNALFAASIGLRLAQTILVLQYVS